MTARFSPEEVDVLLHDLSARIRGMVEHFGDDIPDYFDVASGAWRVNGGWTEGFWPGLMWWLCDYSTDAQLERAARRITAQVAGNYSAWDDHDLGFIFGPSCVLENRVTGDRSRVPAGLAAARRLAARYLPNGRYIPAHGPVHGPRAGFAIIDSVMNLELLFWAAKEGGDPRLAEVAASTARTIAQRHVRGDGSSCQVLWLDPASGEIVRPEAVMAVSVDSCWARGQAWGIHGFAMVYRYTGDVFFRRLAEHMTNYFVSRLPADGVVFHDLDDPAIPRVPRDSSAQTIAAGGLLTLAECATCDAERLHWLKAAERLLGPLLESCINKVETRDRPRGLLGRGCKSLRKQQGVVSDLIFGDYYFVAALIRWRRLNANN